MELVLTKEDLYPDNRDKHAYSLTTSDFKPKVITVIEAVREAGGKVFYTTISGGRVTIPDHRFSR